MERLTDEQLWSWVDRDATELAEYLREHPDDRARVAALREQIAGVAVRELPESVAGYRVLGRLGEGAMGVVLRAEQPNPKREVALKLIHGGGLASERTLALFAREAAALASLRHPGIATIYEAGRALGQPFLAMELCEGVPLDAFVASERPTEAERLTLFLRIADAMAHAHQAGIVHRDLKPSNLLVDAAARPKVVDFGLARLADADATQRTRAGLVVGTLRYMSPEQARGAAADARSDVYSLGVILYELLTGAPPFAGEAHDLEAMLRAIRETAPRPPRQHDPKVARDLEAIVLCCLAKEQDARYAHAGELAADLRRYRGGQPVHAARPSVLHRVHLAARRNRSRLAVGASLALAGAVVVFAFNELSEADEPQPDFLREMAGSGYPKLAPFAAVRWRAEQPEVRVDDEWWELRAVAGHDVRKLVSFSKVTAGSQFWSKRFEEDLVEILTRVDPRRPPGERVDLTLRDLATGSVVEKRGVPLSAELRRQLRVARLRSPFESVRWHRKRPEVRIGDRWFRLLSVQGERIDAVLAYCHRVQGPEWRFAFELALDHVLIELGSPAGAAARLGLVDLETGVEAVRDVACTRENARRLHDVWLADRAAAERLGLAGVAQRAPFAGLRWDADRPEVLWNGAWSELEEIDGRAVSDLVDFLQRAFPKTWRVRVGEDLPAVFAACFDARLGATVDLVLRSSGEQVTVRGAPATEANRELVRSVRALEDRP